jgi:amino-acid N-acetyltransferase
MYTGFPRRVEVEKIRQVLAANDIVLLTALGTSPSGEVFNVNSENLAAAVAGSLAASKVIYFTVEGTAFRDIKSKKLVQNLRASDARNLLDYHRVQMHQSRGFASIEDDTNHSPAMVEALLKVGWSMSALQKGVKRAHIIAPTNGALLQELYTRDGSGTLISRDIYEGIRRADVNDVASIYDLIDPLVSAGTLVVRPSLLLS